MPASRADERLDAEGAPTPETEEAENEREQAAYRVLDAWRRASGSKLLRAPRAWLDLVRDRLEEYDEETLVRAVEGARYASWFCRDADRRIPSLIFRDARNVEQCANAAPVRRTIPARAPDDDAAAPPRERDEAQTQTNLTGIAQVLAAIRP